MYPLQKKIETLLGLFGAQSIVSPCPPRYASGMTLRDEVRSCEFAEP